MDRDIFAQCCVEARHRTAEEVMLRREGIHTPPIKKAPLTAEDKQRIGSSYEFIAVGAWVVWVMTPAERKWARSTLPFGHPARGAPLRSHLARLYPAGLVWCFPMPIEARA